MERSSISLSYYPCLSELLTLPVFRGSRLLGCQTGLERVVTGVNLSDTPEYYKWLCAGELMVTTCYSIHDDPAALAQFIPTLAAGGMSGLCVKPGQYLQAVPREMIDAAFAPRGLSYELLVSGAPGECRTLARQAAQSGEEVRLYACGGDGTIPS